MDFSTIMGLGLGLVILAGALILGHVPPQSLLNPEAILIVFGGTLAATIVSFKQEILWRALRALRESGRDEACNDLPETVSYVMDVVGFVRDEGILALQPIIESVEIPFFRKGLKLVLDNRAERFIRDSLTTEIEVNFREQMDHARVFETAGGFAPTMGIIGAVIGLIYTVHSFTDPGALGKGVAAAFSATLYGVAASNLFLLPIAGRMRQRAKDEWFLRSLLLEAVLSIRAGEHPMLIEERLTAFISPNAQQGEAARLPKSYASAPMEGILPPRAVLDDDFLQVGGH
jgi:chemotaxis protein MotA